MKKLSLLLIFLISIKLIGFSQAPYSSLTIFSEDGYPFNVIINGLNKNAEARTNVKTEGLTNPNYKIKIIFEDKTIPAINKTVYTKPGMEVTYRIKKDRKGNNILRYYSETALPYDYTYQEPVYQNNINNGITKTNTNGTGVHIDMNVNETGGNVSIQTDDGGVNLNTNVNINDENVSYNSSAYNNETHYEVTEEHYVMPGYEGSIGCPWPMNPNNFRRAKQTISNADFSSDKQTIAQQIVNSNCLTAQQVKEIADLFDFESDKLKFAKFAYTHTYDIENYFIINDIFDFSSSIKELNNYINSAR
ncbi:MAG: DUF4476 domain-containing protein [Chlorobi bacterium]|nr:DUF4476 domain-containing protein [Chlorobiota bacterium]